MQLDLQNANVVIGALFATVDSICITLLNSDWKLRSSDRAEIELPDQTCTANEPHNVLCPLEAGVPLDSNPSRTDIEGPDQVPIQSMMLARFLSMESSFSSKISKLFPSGLQSDLERAFIAYYMFFHFNTGYGWFNNEEEKVPFPLSPFPAEKKAGPTLWFAWIFTPWYRDVPLPTYLNWIYICTALCYAQILRIVLRNTSCAISQCGIGRRLPMRLCRLCSSLDAWIFSGRSIIAFPFNLAMLLPVVLRIGILVYISWFYQDMENYFYREATRGERMRMSLFMWKDPWQENMYIL